jgi:hypothetical protein
MLKPALTVALLLAGSAVALAEGMPAPVNADKIKWSAAPPALSPSSPAIRRPTGPM